MSKPLGLLAVAVAALAVPFSFIPASHAAPDMEAPRVVSYYLTDADGGPDLVYLVDREEAVIRARIRVIDETGIASSPQFYVHSKKSTQGLSVESVELVAGDGRDGTYEAVIRFPYGKAAGEWYVGVSIPSDVLGNWDYPSKMVDGAQFGGRLGEFDIRYGKPAPGAEPIVDEKARTVTIPETTHAAFYADGEKWAPGLHKDLTGEVLLELRPDDGYAIESGETNWDARFGFPLQFTPPSFRDEDGWLVIPEPVMGEQCDGDYCLWNRGQAMVNGVPVSGNMIGVEGTVVVTLEPGEGFFLDKPATWTHTFPSKSPFVDVRPGAPFYEDIVWMGKTGRSTGWPGPWGREYRPTLDVNRDAMAAFLYRQAGSPVVRLPAKSPFKDVQPGQDHYAAIIWAHQKGITTGYSDGTFRPTQPINRDAMAAFLYRYADKPAFAAPTKAPFKDVPASRPFAKEIAWMSSTGITTGYGDGTFRPLGTVKRDAMAAFIHRYDTKF